MIQEHIMLRGDVDVLLELLHTNGYHREETLIYLIAYKGYTAQKLADLTRADIDGRCDVYLKDFKPEEKIFPFTRQYINLLLRRVQDRFSIKTDVFNVHFFRKSFAYYEFMKNRNILGKREALKKVMVMIDQYNIKDTLKYLNLTMEDIQDEGPSKLKILKGPTDEESKE